jgi:hypothetical protein
VSALVEAPTLTLRPPDLLNLDGQTDEQTGRAHLSYSGVSTALACHKRFEFRYVQGIELIAKPKPLAMGKAFHHGIEHRDPLAGANLLDRSTDDQDDFDRLLIDKAIVACATKAYLERWNTEGIQREVGYRIRLRSPYTGAYSRTFDLMGYADGVIDHGSHLELVEDKLRGTIDAQSVRRVALDRQVALESYALWRITGKPVRIIRYRFVRKPSIKKRQGETTGAFIQRLEADYTERRDDFYSHEEQSFRSDEDLLTIEAELWEWAMQLRGAMHRGVFARNTDSCGDYGGCEFVPLCLGEPDAPALYRPKTNDGETE